MGQTRATVGWTVGMLIALYFRLGFIADQSNSVEEAAEILAEGMLGFVVMVDSTKPETFREAKSILETFRAYAPTPYVVAANKQDQGEAWNTDDLRIALRIEDGVKLLPCVARDKESVKTVLLELLYSILKEMES